MRVDSHRLVGDGVRFVASPNGGGPFDPGVPDTLVLHFTAGDDAEWAIRKLCDPTAGQRVSAHVLVSRDGGVTQLLPFDLVGWHAGLSSWGGRSDYNRLSLGIEIDNPGRLEERDGVLVSWLGQEYGREQGLQAVHRNENEPSWWLRYPEEQLQTVEALCRVLVVEYELRWILGHEEIAPERKDDPGPGFPLDEMRGRILGAPLA